MRSPLIPSGAEIVRTYAEYDRLVDAFFQSRYHLLVLVGRPGLAKSVSFERRLGPASHLIRGWTAPLQCYVECFEHRNQLLVFDDAEALWKRPAGRVLLRSLCEHRARKQIAWTSTAPGLKAAGVPLSFTTSSKVALVANRFVFGDQEECAAVADRAHIVYFDPSPLEVHARVAEWFWNQEVYDFIGGHLHLLDSPSTRLYLKAFERREAGGDWRRLVREAFCHDHNVRVVQALEADPACKSVDDRVRKFIETTGGCRATFFNIKRRLVEQNKIGGPERFQVPKLAVQGVPPVDLDAEAAAAPGERTSPSAGPSEQGESEAGHDPADWWRRGPAVHDEASSGDENPGCAKSADDHLKSLRRQLKRAVQREDYERAAVLRDRIAQLEAEAGGDAS